MKNNHHILARALIFSIFLSSPILTYLFLEQPIKAESVKNDLNSSEINKLDEETINNLLKEGAISEKNAESAIKNLNNPIKIGDENQDQLSNKLQGSVRLQIKQITKNNQNEIIIQNIEQVTRKEIIEIKEGWLINIFLQRPIEKIEKINYIEDSEVSTSFIPNNNLLMINISSPKNLQKPKLISNQKSIKIITKVKQKNSKRKLFGLAIPKFLGRDNHSSPTLKLRKRAIAPPLGDIAVGSILLKNRGFVELDGPDITLKLPNAPALTSLMELAELGGYGFVHVKENLKNSKPIPNVTLSFKNENYAKALNTILLASGLQGKKDGNLLIVGKNVLSKSFGPQLSKVYRLNQASAISAADYLASLGAQINKVNVISSATVGSSSGTTGSNSYKESVTAIDTYSASSGPLRGLIGTTDSRLQTITLIGSANLIEIAEKYLKQLDLRQRQVALSVKILDIDLSNTDDMQNDLAIRMGSTFIVSNNGELRSVFGSYLPSNLGNISPIITNKSSNQSTSTSNSNSNAAINSNSQNNTSSQSNSANENTTFGNDITSSLDGTNSNSSATNLSTSNAQDNQSSNNNEQSNSNNLNSNNANSSISSSGNDTTQSSSKTPNPGLNYPNKELYTYLVAKIRSSSTKVLANPTLILSESPEGIRGGSQQSASTGISGSASIGRPYANESFISVGKQVITDFKVTQSNEGGAIGCEPSFETSGLTFGARVNKIDDNGYVTFSLSPKLTAVTEKFPIPNCGSVNILNVRRLDTGTLRVRDSQTLILTGVISDFDSEVVNKWPLLGDIPVVGRLFRSTSGEKRKSELVIMVTPRIINDTNTGLYGYGYTPSTKASKEIMRNQK